MADGCFYRLLALIAANKLVRCSFRASLILYIFDLCLAHALRRIRGVPSVELSSLSVKIVLSCPRMAFEFCTIERAESDNEVAF